MLSCEEWLALAIEDMDAVPLLEKTLQDLEASLTELEALAPFSGPYGQLDCFVEVTCDHDQGLYYKLRAIAKVAEQQGYVITTLNEDDRIAVWEVQGHLAFARLRQFAGKFIIPHAEIFGEASKDRIQFEVKVYPIPKFFIDRGPRKEDLAFDIYKATRSCCANHPGGLRILHKPTGLAAEVLSHNGQAWCEDKAMQLLRCKLQAHHPKS